MVSLPIVKSGYLEPEHLGDKYQHPHAAPQIVEQMQSWVFYILSSNFLPKHVHLPKAVLKEHCTQPPLLNINLLQPAQDREQATKTVLSSDGPLIA